MFVQLITPLKLNSLFRIGSSKLSRLVHNEQAKLFQSGTDLIFDVKQTFFLPDSPELLMSFPFYDQQL